MPMVEQLVSINYAGNQTVSTQILLFINRFLHTWSGFCASFIIIISIYILLLISFVHNALGGNERKLNFVALAIITVITTLSLMVCGALRLI
jgi:type II secretory pathway component PulF